MVSVSKSDHTFRLESTISNVSLILNPVSVDTEKRSDLEFGSGIADIRDYVIGNENINLL